MHEEINSPDISKIYACVFRTVKIPMRTLYKHISLNCISLRHLQIIAVNWWQWLTTQFLLLSSFKNF